MNTSASLTCTSTYTYSKNFYLDYYKKFEPYPSIFSLNIHLPSTEDLSDIETISLPQLSLSESSFPEGATFEHDIASLLLCPEALEKMPVHFTSNAQLILILYAIFHRKYIQLVAEYQNKVEARVLWQRVLSSTQWIDSLLLNNPTFIKALIQRMNDCRILFYAGDIVRNDKKLINHYVVNHPVGGEMVYLVGEELMHNHKFLYRFLDKHANAIWNLPDYLLTESFFLKTLPHFPMLFETISQALRADLHFIIKAGKCFSPDKLDSYFIPYIADDNLMMVMMAEFDATGNILQTIHKIELKLKLDEHFSGSEKYSIDDTEIPNKI